MLINRNFLFLFCSRFLSVFADAMLFVILLTMLGSYNTNSFGLSLFYIFATLPVILFSLPAGAYVGRKYLQKVMAVSNIVRFAFIIGLACTTSFYQSPIIIYLFIFVNVVSNVFYLPANSSLLPKVVQEERLAKANSYIQLTMLFAKIASYSIGAWLIKSGLSIQTLLIMISAFYIVSMLLVLLIKPYYINRQEQKKNIWQNVKEGFHFIRLSPLYSRLFMIFGAAWLVGSSVDLYLISYLVEVLGKSHEDLYLITTFSLIGISFGAFLAPYVYKKTDPKNGIYLSSVAFSIVILLFSLKLPLGILLPSLVIGGLAQGIFIIFINTYLQSHVPDEYLPRIYSIYNFIYTGVSLPGYLFFGYLIEQIGAISTGFIMSAYLLCIAIITVVLLPSMREQKSEILE
ncbi:MFS transporter [Metasolibacillus meyeri]|uniref:MFS transporter n=1 Tax=Metasolibacillus meyeri TaxID=1071052 RepID=UPI000D2FF606|nr:MFS transporter [Metasolibacillus meyeri]